MREKVQAVIDEIRPYLQADGGDIELVDIEEGGIVKVRLRGACAGGPGAKMTLQMGVERKLKGVGREVTQVIGVD